MEKTHSMTPGFPAPNVDVLSEPFWSAAQRSQLVIQQCCKCADIHFPPAPVCPRCLAAEQRWIPASGRATLFTWGVFHKAYWDSVAELTPYLVAVVELEEGPRLMTNLVGIDTEDQLRLGMPLEVTFRQQSPDFQAPVFRPEAE